MASLDTNALLRWCLHDIPEQTMAVQDILQKHSEIQVADAAIIEMVFVLEKVYDLPRTIVTDCVRALMGEAAVNCNRTLFDAVLDIYNDHPALSLMDCCLSVYVSLNQAEPLLTFDKKLAHQLPNAQLLS